jgi:hypothetical protein
MRTSLLVSSWLLVVAGCNPNEGNGVGHVGGGGGGVDGGAGADDLAAPTGGDDGGSGGNGCVGLACQQVSCSGGATTTLTGTVFAPNGTLPLYNAIVYVPNATVDPFPSGVTCDRCNGQVSGSPLVTALTGPDGTFTLANVPAGANIPLVIQVGRWRRQVTIPSVTACQSTAITDPSLLRLPRNASEGNLPQMAIATGSSDPFECLLLKIGIDAAEFTSPSAAKPGRVHFFTATDSAGTNLSPAAPSATTLYASLTNLLRYDLIILPCEGDAYAKDATARGLFVQYANAGGRLFTTHYSYDWLSYAGSPFDAIGKWDLDQSYPDDPTVGIINQSFPKGLAFAKWLKTVDPTSTAGQLSISSPRHDIDSVDPTHGQPWIGATVTPPDGGSPSAVMHLTFDTPLDAPPDDAGAPAYCGKVVFSDFHVSTDTLSSTQTSFPGVCMGGAMTAQEKALAFMLFDLSSCVQPDNQPPIS